ncbi:hypothetical protein B0H16DRAFT_1750500 [Mycena metata]|uniref:Uncharacterized protein n=1 Tax=Mycena metata TaxID=1033252 RepID=A0AAD7GHZ2_9AGAR|nr:hypothetical protein B0H16DRAFT_1750500 [Mycena metata]
MYNYESPFNAVIKLFENPTSPWTVNTLAWYQKGVFGNCEKTGADASDDEDEDSEVSAIAARSSASSDSAYAYNSSTAARAEINGSSPCFLSWSSPAFIWDKSHELRGPRLMLVSPRLILSLANTVHTPPPWLSMVINGSDICTRSSQIAVSIRLDFVLYCVD